MAHCAICSETIPNKQGVNCRDCDALFCEDCATDELTDNYCGSCRAEHAREQYEDWKLEEYMMRRRA